MRQKVVALCAAQQVWPLAGHINKKTWEFFMLATPGFQASPIGTTGKKRLTKGCHFQYNTQANRISAQPTHTLS
jgi:hypothetical protein